jgi:hypothetical protein
MSGCFRGLAILCRRLIAAVAAVTYMQGVPKSKATMHRGMATGGPEVNDGVE